MKTSLLSLFLLGMISLSGQTSSTEKENKDDIFDIGAIERIMYAKVIYEQGEKKKAKSILKTIIQEELDIKTDTAKYGIYSTIAALNLIKIDSLLGIESLLKIIKHFEGLNCIECLSNLKRIRNHLREWSGREYELPYEMIYFLEESNIYQNSFRRDKEWLNSELGVDSVRFYSFGMGGGFEIIMTQDSFIFKRGRWNSDNGITVVKEGKSMSKIEWGKILSILENLGITRIPEIEQPEGSRHFDGAYYSSITIYDENEAYKSQSFDDFWPSEELKPIVYYIRYLFRKKLNY